MPEKIIAESEDELLAILENKIAQTEFCRAVLSHPCAQERVLNLIAEKGPIDVMNDLVALSIAEGMPAKEKAQQRLHKEGIKRTFIAFGEILLVIMVDYYLFSILFGLNYFEWYIKGGPLIGLSLAFISQVWNKLDENEWLVSANPANYVAGCIWVLAVILASIGTNIKRSHTPLPADSPSPSCLTIFWDSLISLLVYLMLLIVVVLWLLVVAPLTYFVNLVAGAPARKGLLNPDLKTVVKKEGRTTVIGEADANQPGDKEMLDVSFARKPVSMTAAIAAILLWLTRFALESSSK